MSVRSFRMVFFSLSMIFSFSALAQEAPTLDLSGSSQPSGAYQGDISKPDANEALNATPPQADTKPASFQSTQLWQGYDAPIRDCIEGNSILPSDGNDVFGFLFNNNAQTDVSMNIIGWKKDKCAINFNEGTNMMYCRLNKSSLNQFMQTVLNADMFDRTSKFAQMLTENCQPTDPDANPSSQ